MRRSFGYLAVLSALPMAACSSNTTGGTRPNPTPPGDAATTGGDGMSMGDLAGGDIALPPPGDTALPGDSNLAPGDLAGDSYIPGPTNNPPIVNAGMGQIVLVGSVVNLTGMASDPDPGDMLTTMWTQTAGPAVTILNPSALFTSFVASVPGGSMITLRLQACDLAMVCVADVVTITVNAVAVFDTHVAPYGADDTMTNDGSQMLPWLTINFGITQAAMMVTPSQGAVVHVAAGTYPEAVVMDDGVSIWGSYDATVMNAWVRSDVMNDPTIIDSPNALGIHYSNAVSFTLPTDLDGLIILNSNTAGDTNNVTIEGATGAIRDSIIRIPNGGSADVYGIVLDANNNPVDFVLSNVTIEEGNTSATMGRVIGMDLLGNSAPTLLVTAVNLTIDLTMADKRFHRGIQAVASTLNMANSSVTIAPTSTPMAMSLNEVSGIFGDQSVLNISSTTVDAGGGFDTMRGIEVTDGSTLNLTDVTVDGGNAIGPPMNTSSSHAIFLSNAMGGNSVANLLRVTARGGQVNSGGMAIFHRSFGFYAQDGSDVTIVDSTISAGPGDWGVGIRLLDVLSAHIQNTDVNPPTLSNVCMGRQCQGIFVETGTPKLVQQLAPQTPLYSCCDPLHYQVTVEGSRITGGTAATADGIWAGGMPPPSMCVSASQIDAGQCAASTGSATCRGIRIVQQMDFALHNNVVYGGQTMDGAALQVRKGIPEASIANNYFHGGDPLPGGPPLGTTRGLFITVGMNNNMDGMRILNNIFDSGTGNDRYGVIEENHNSDPMRFHFNNVVVNPQGTPAVALMYRNCTQMCCGSGCMPSMDLTTVMEVNSMLTGPNQGTQVANNNMTDNACMVDNNPTTGDWHQAGGSNCVNAGVERNGSCNICQTPWVDFYGAHRLDFENRLSNGGMNCPVIDCNMLPTPAGCVSMMGDDSPDIGPGEN